MRRKAQTGFAALRSLFQKPKMFTPAFRRFVWAGCALFAAAGTPACTLFGAVGEGMVEGGGTLAAKTRDEHPGPQRFDIAVPSKGYAYLGLFTGDKHRFNMGFNEKGLFLARSTSGSLLRKERLALPRFFKHRLSATDWIMQHYASVDEVLAHKEVFVEPVNYLLADRTKIAVVEVMPGGQTTVRITEHGTAAHTNHFIEPESEALNQKIGSSSARRLERIRELLAAADKPLKIADMAAMTRDRHDGPVRSIWRTGTKPDGVQTLAAIAVSLPSIGNPSLNLTWRTDPNNPRAMDSLVCSVAPEDFKMGTAAFRKKCSAVENHP